VVRNAANTGLAGTLRAVCSEITTPYIAIHGSGDLSLRGRFRAQADVLDAEPEVVAVGCELRSTSLINGLVQEDVRAPAWGTATRLVRPTDVLLARPAYSHGEAMFRRSAYEAAGGYRAVFKFAQDRDLWLRLSLLGDFALVPEVLYDRRILPGGVAGSYDKRSQQIVFTQLARECIRQRRVRGTDDVDELGPLAFGAFRSFDAAKELWRHALVAALAGRREAVDLPCRLAAQHGPAVVNAPIRWSTKALAASPVAVRSLARRGVELGRGGKVDWDRMN
jgi:hypothetical protein